MHKGTWIGQNKTFCLQIIVILLLISDVLTTCTGVFGWTEDRCTNAYFITGYLYFMSCFGKSNAKIVSGLRDFFSYDSNQSVFRSTGVLPWEILHRISFNFLKILTEYILTLFTISSPMCLWIPSPTPQSEQIKIQTRPGY